MFLSIMQVQFSIVIIVTLSDEELTFLYASPSISPNARQHVLGETMMKQDLYSTLP